VAVHVVTVTVVVVSDVVPVHVLDAVVVWTDMEVLV